MSVLISDIIIAWLSRSLLFESEGIEESTNAWAKMSTLCDKGSQIVWRIHSYHMYSRDHKFVVFCFALLLPQILDDFQNQGQFWILQVLTISKHPLLVQFN